MTPNYGVICFRNKFRSDLNVMRKIRKVKVEFESAELALHFLF